MGLNMKCAFSFPSVFFSCFQHVWAVEMTQHHLQKDKQLVYKHRRSLTSGRFALFGLDLKKSRDTAGRVAQAWLEQTDALSALHV